MSRGLPPKVFISHSTTDDPAGAAFVGLLCSRLVDWQVEPWLDRDRLVGGEVWNDRLRLEIARCDAAILFVTPRYLRDGDPYARDEALIFAQRAATEPFDDFRLLILVSPGVDVAALATTRWANLELPRRQMLPLTSLERDAVDALKPSIDVLLERYRSGAVPLVLREHYADMIGKQASTAVLAHAAALLELELQQQDATPRRFVNAVLNVSPALRRPLRVLVNSLQAWRQVLDEQVRVDLSWDAVAFTWLDDEAAQPVAEVVRERGLPGRKLLVLVSEEADVARLHLRRVRDEVAPFDDTQADAGATTREGLIRAICVEVRTRRAPRQRDPRDVADADIEAFARELDGSIGETRPLVVLLDRDVCQPDVLDGLPQLFSNVILVALVGTEMADLDPMAVVVRPNEEREVLAKLDAALL